MLLLVLVNGETQLEWIFGNQFTCFDNLMIQWWLYEHAKKIWPILLQKLLTSSPELN